MASDLTNYLNSVGQLISRRNGTQLAKFLALPLKSSDGPLPNLADKIKKLNVINVCENNLKDQMTAPIVAYVLSALVSVYEKDFEAAYRHENAAYSAVLDYFAQKDENVTWIIPVLVRVSNDLRVLAEQNDEKNADINYKFLRESISVLTRGFTIVAKERSPITQAGSKKLAIFAATNVLFKIYFKVNTLQLCSKLINVVEGPGAIMDNLSYFPMCDVAMYKYYTGRLQMFEDKYEEARDSLSYALKCCPQASLKNRQRILAALAPVQMCLGVMPAPTLGTIYGLHELAELSLATRRGDIRSFNSILEKNRTSFIRLGVYLVLEQVKIVAYRNYFKRVYHITGNTRLNLNSFEIGLKWLGEQDVDLDEIECMLANLIFQNKIKGYISHQKRFLIVSKTGPFPTAGVVKRKKVN